MKISYNWLKDYVSVKLAPDKLAELLNMAGLGVESVKVYGGDHIFEIEITANRPDWLSVIGVAREVAALTGGKLKMPEVSKIKTKPSPAGLKIRVEDRALCPRYTARIIRNVKVGESPAWLKARIEAMGLRSVNNIVDITNFCLFETGEPMHAFDLDKITGQEVTVRKALQGEKVITIDGSEKTLDKTMLIIADSKKPIAIAGVMGAQNTEVTVATKNILLEAACFDQVSVRRTSRKLAISTDSSYRFERRVDIENILYASSRASDLIAKLAAGEIGAVVDVGAKEVKKRTVTVSVDKVNSLLGTAISASEISKMAAALGMSVKPLTKKALKVDIPNFRGDIRADVDIIEEVARVYGYAKIPATLPRIVEQPVRMERDMVIRNKIRQSLIALGLDEIITYSLLSKKVAAACGSGGGEAVSVANPLTSEQESMRPSLIPGMLNAVSWNINRKTKDLKLFEIGNVYFTRDNKYGEKMRLCMGMTGNNVPGWTAGPTPCGFFDLKGAVETLFAELGITATFTAVKTDGFSPSESACIYISGDGAGVIGQISQKTLHEFDIKDKVYALEIDIDTVLKYADTEKRFHEISKYPAVHRDISILAAKDALNADLVSAMAAAGAPILTGIKLIDRYEGKQIPDGKQSLTYRLEYSDPSKTLEEKDVLDYHGRVLRELESKFGAKLR